MNVFSKDAFEQECRIVLQSYSNQMLCVNLFL